MNFLLYNAINLLSPYDSISRNVLLTSNSVCKVSGFELARHAGEDGLDDDHLRAFRLYSCACCSWNDSERHEPSSPVALDGSRVHSGRDFHDRIRHLGIWSDAVGDHVARAITLRRTFVDSFFHKIYFFDRSLTLIHSLSYLQSTT